MRHMIMACIFMFAGINVAVAQNRDCVPTFVNTYGEVIEVIRGMPRQKNGSPICRLDDQLAIPSDRCPSGKARAELAKEWVSWVKAFRKKVGPEALILHFPCLVWNPRINRWVDAPRNRP